MLEEASEKRALQGGESADMLCFLSATRQGPLACPMYRGSLQCCMVKRPGLSVVQGEDAPEVWNRAVLMLLSGSGWLWPQPTKGGSYPLGKF